MSGDTVRTFRKGDRVRMTEDGIRQRLLQKRSGWMGTVIEQLSVFSVLVLPDTYKRPHEFSISFWEKV